MRSPILLDDLFADLLWPKLLRAPVLALSPGRVLLAAFFVLVAAVVFSILRALEQALGWRGSEEALAHWGTVRAAALSIPNWWTPGASGAAWVQAMLSLPLAAVRAHPLLATAGTAVGLVLWCLAGGALARSCVCELAGNVRCSWPESVGYAAGRWASLLGALLVPMGLVALLALACMLGGLVLLRVPGLNLLGALLFGVVLIASFVAVVVLVLFAVAHNLLIPAVAADGSDAVDAIQRAYAYVLGRPARYVAYMAIAIVQGAVVIGIAVAIIAGVRTFATATTSKWAGDDARTMVAQANAAATGGEEAERTVLRDAAIRQALMEEKTVPTEADAKPERLVVYHWGARIVELWLLLLSLVLAGFVVSYVHAAASIVYLLMRRLNDGQDLAEIWQARAVYAEAGDGGGGGGAVSEAVGDAD